MMKKTKITALLLALSLLAGCGSAAQPAPAEDAAYIDQTEVSQAEIGAEVAALSFSPAAIHNLLLPEASGKQTEKNGKAVIDYSNIADGYVMAQFTAI